VLARTHSLAGSIMTRIFPILAILVFALMTAALVTGFLSQKGGGVGPPEQPIFLLHFILGLFTAIAVLMIHCLIFTYFLGTGRWVKEVTREYRLPDEPLHRLTRDLKRKTFPPALSAMLVTIATTAAGAGVQMANWPWLTHAAGAAASLLVNCWAFFIEFRNVRANLMVIDQVMVEVERLRSQLGLVTNADA
jgi:hypothetical protein